MFYNFPGIHHLATACGPFTYCGATTAVQHSGLIHPGCTSVRGSVFMPFCISAWRIHSAFFLSNLFRHVNFQIRKIKLEMLGLMGRNSGNADERPIKWTTVSGYCTNHGCMAQMVAGNMIATQCGLDKLSYLRELDSASLPGFFSGCHDGSCSIPKEEASVVEGSSGRDGSKNPANLRLDEARGGSFSPISLNFPHRTQRARQTTG